MVVYQHEYSVELCLLYHHERVGEKKEKLNTYQLRFAEVPRTCGSSV
jgi:hypothetical protein